MPVEGAIQILLDVRNGVFSRVEIRNRRLLTATARLAGRSSGDVPGLVARLFSICRIAQGLASAEAVEQAMDLAPGAAQRDARRFLIAAETLLEHASRACLDWAVGLGEPPALAALKSLRGALADAHRLVYPAGDWMRPGGGHLQIDRTALEERLALAGRGLERVVLSAEPPVDPAGWRRWLAAGDSIAARLAARWIAEDLAGYGATAVPALPVFDRTRLEERLAADAKGDFVGRPDWDGALCFTGPLARLSDHPLVGHITAEHGRGLLAHLAARVIEMGVLMREMQDFGLGLCDDYSSQLKSAGSPGMAVVEAARGRLAHRVELSEGRVMRYQILAPTEWNFHPDGVLAQGLLDRPTGQNPEARARLLVTALDPCVACQIEVA
jgi:hypothetical protein